MSLDVCDMLALSGELSADEGYRKMRYRCPAGKWTIGIGHNLEGKVFLPATWAAIQAEHPHLTNALLDDQTVLSDDLIDRIFREDIADAIGDVDAIWIGWRNLSEERKRALINMSFQMGGYRLAQFRLMWAALRAHDFVAAAHEAQDSAWFKQTQPSRTGRVLRQIREG